MKILLCSTFWVITSFGYAQNIQSVRSALTRHFPIESHDPYRLMFLPDSSKVEALDSLAAGAFFPGFKIFSTELKFYPRPDWYILAVVLIDSSSSNLIVHLPLSQGGLTPELKALVCGKTFSDTAQLEEFVHAFHEMRKIGSLYKFIPVSKTDTSRTYDLVWFEDQNYLFKPYRNSAETNYTPKQLAGKFRIILSKNMIVDYVENSR